MSQLTQTTSRMTLDQLVERGSIEIAVDTEFQDGHTLTIQLATRMKGGPIAIKVYRSAAIPPFPRDLDLTTYLPADHSHYGRFFHVVTQRPTSIITPDLSPARMLQDLFNLADIEPISRHEGRRLILAGPPNGVLSAKDSGWTVPSIRIILVGHFLPADFGRIFGRAFYDELFHHDPGAERPLTFSEGKVLGLAYAGGSAFARAPVVQYVRSLDGSIYELRLESRDTALPFGPGSLDRHSDTFLRLPKSHAVSEADKQDMFHTFRTKTAVAYGYAIIDAVNTLLLHEQMQDKDREIYRSFGVAENDIPPMKPTLGGRVARFLTAMTKVRAAGSKTLESDRSLRAMMRKSGRTTFGGERATSRFGFQTGQVHGGLAYTRSPTRFWHNAPGMIRDVDMSGCYPTIISGINLYWGRPIVHEPGSKPITLRQAVDLLAKHCDSDAWYVRVTGDILAGYNVLIPSTQDAIIASNYRRKKPPGPDLEGARLYTRRIESGIVTDATWRMIQALPKALRLDYERLSAESLVFYPRKLVADDGPGFDRMVEQAGLRDLPWAADLDLRAMSKTIVEHLDADYVSLKFPIHQVASAMRKHRKEAQERDGKGSGLDQAWKLQANTIYGVVTSPHFATGNAVAANVVTAKARAGAFALINALNGIQVITDGCTYRRDQIPACTFAECLQRQADYPLRRAEEGGSIPFRDPAGVPVDDHEFTTWYRAHVRRFFRIDGEVTDAPFDLHDLEHKVSANVSSFDALACDGSGCNLKCSRSTSGAWEVKDMAMRGHGRDSKEKLKDWILETYSTDHLTHLPPITEDRVLLQLKEARAKASQFLASGSTQVIFPLGYPQRKILAYSPIRLSAFTFRDPQQWRSMQRQVKRLKQVTGSGLEALTLRRSYAGRASHSLTVVAEEIYALIQAGQRDLSKALHLTRLSKPIQETLAERSVYSTYLKDKARDDLLARIDANNLDPKTLTASIICTTSRETCRP